MSGRTAKPKKVNPTQSTVPVLTSAEIAESLAISLKKRYKCVTVEMAKEFYAAFVELISDELKRNGKFNITNLGSFETYLWGGFHRNAYNVYYGKYIPEIAPVTIALKFIPSDFIKAYLNNETDPLKAKRRAKEVRKREYQQEQQKLAKVPIDKAKKYKTKFKTQAVLGQKERMVRRNQKYFNLLKPTTEVKEDENKE